MTHIHTDDKSMTIMSHTRTPMYNRSMTHDRLSCIILTGAGAPFNKKVKEYLSLVFVTSIGIGSMGIQKAKLQFKFGGGGRMLSGMLRIGDRVVVNEKKLSCFDQHGTVKSTSSPGTSAETIYVRLDSPDIYTDAEYHSYCPQYLDKEDGSGGDS